MLNGVLWVLCSGATWRDMPERFGPWSTVYQRFRDWRNQGIFNKMLTRLHHKLNAQGLIDLNTWCIDSTAVRATRASSGAGKKGAPKNQRTTHLDEAGAGWRRKFTWSVTLVASHSTSRSQAETPATSPMLNDCWTVSTSLRVEVGHASVAVGSWPTKGMTQNPCDNTATAIGCNR